MTYFPTSSLLLLFVYMSGIYLVCITNLNINTTGGEVWFNQLSILREVFKNHDFSQKAILVPVAILNHYAGITNE